MGKNAKPGQYTDGRTICVEMMDITDLGATENQAAGITVMSDSAKNVIRKVSRHLNIKETDLRTMLIVVFYD